MNVFAWPCVRPVCWLDFGLTQGFQEFPMKFAVLRLTLCSLAVVLAGCGSLRDVDNKWCDPQPAQAATVEKKTD